MVRSVIARLRHWFVAHVLNFNFWQARGVHILPVSYDSPVPDTGHLDDAVFERRSSLPGIRMNDAAQVALLGRLAAAYRDEYARFPLEATSEPHRYHVNNGGYESVDGEILYCMVRDLKPRRIFEIGSGNSTYVAAEAALRNGDGGSPECDLIAFEPYPNEVLRAGFPGLSSLVSTLAQDIPLSRFEELERDDILFIDSSHVIKIGSDVQYLFLEVLPRLRPGVVVHVHDIFLPAEYRKDWVRQQRWFWNEQYILQAFLAFNDSFEVMWAGSYMHLEHPIELAAAIPSYDSASRWPGSIWMRKTA